MPPVMPVFFLLMFFTSTALVFLVSIFTPALFNARTLTIMTVHVLNRLSLNLNKKAGVNTPAKHIFRKLLVFLPR